MAHFGTPYKFRGYLRLSGGEYELHRAAQGTLWRIDDPVEDLPSIDGVYRVSGILLRSIYTIKTASLVKDVGEEADKLATRAGEMRKAWTASPGISGFSQRAGAADAAVVNRRQEAKRLADLLRSWA